MASSPNFKFQTRRFITPDGFWTDWEDAQDADLLEADGFLVLDLADHLTQVRVVFLPEDSDG